VHEYASGLTSTPKAELFCSCKRRKFIGQNKVKICKLQSQNFKPLGQKVGCPNHKPTHSESEWQIDTSTLDQNILYSKSSQTVGRETNWLDKSDVKIL